MSPARLNKPADDAIEGAESTAAELQRIFKNVLRFCIVTCPTVKDSEVHL